MKALDVIKKAGLDTGKFIKVNSPIILTAASIVGFGTTIALTIKASPKALMDYEDAKFEKGKLKQPFTAIDAVKSCWKNYIPAGIVGASTIACIVGSYAISTKRIEGLRAALNVSETALLAYKDEIKEQLGTKKADSLQNAVETKNLQKDPPKSSNTVEAIKCDSDAGRHLIRDTVTGEYFWGNMDKVETAIAKASTKMCNEKLQSSDGTGYISYNDVLELMGRHTCEAGDYIGFNTKMHGDEIELNRNRSAVCPDDSIYPGEVCYLLMYKIPPTSNFDELPFR